MSKTKNGTAVVKHAQGGGEIRPYDAPPFDMPAPEDLIVPRVHLYQGDISAKQYGDHKKGALINTVTMEPLGSRRFVCTGVNWVHWECWAEGRGELIYWTRDRAEVPADDLEWTRDDGVRIPPRAMTYWNLLVMFEDESLPIIVRLKKASKAQRTAIGRLAQLEAKQRAERRAPIVWEFGFTAVENDKGKWLEPDFRNAGLADAEWAARAAEWAAAFRQRPVREQPPVEQPAEGTYDPERDG